MTGWWCHSHRLAYKRLGEAFDGWRSRAELTKHCMLLGQERRARAARSTLGSSFRAWQELAEDQRLQVLTPEIIHNFPPVC